MDYETNPFPNDPDRSAIWTMLVERDIDAFMAADWSMVADDFRAEGFLALHAHGSELPDSWRLGFPTLDVYRDEWLRQAREAQGVDYAEPLRPALFRAMSLRDIDMTGDTAVAHKKFDGTIALSDGGTDVLSWQTLYFCAKLEGRWKIVGFVGYMPFPMGRARTA